jgi:transcriptional regulator with XRE-family HTH domain
MMGKTLDNLMAELSPQRRKRVEDRAAALIAEVKSLQALRQAHKLTQQAMAKKLGVNQNSVSRLEQRSDMLLSTLRDYVHKLGGELELTAKFPGHRPVRIGGLADIVQPRRGAASAKRRSNEAMAPHRAVATKHRPIRKPRTAVAR